MKNNLVTDVKTAVNLFRDMRKERKNGCNIEVKKVVDVPVINCGPTFFNTVEGCRLINGEYQIFESAKQAYDKLSQDEKYKLAHAPKDGEFIARAHFWKSVLRTTMDSKQYRTAIYLILSWYVHIKQMSVKGGAVV